MTASPPPSMLERVFDRYPGSKGAEGVWQRIISEMPPHRVYIEAFLGSGVVLSKKRAAAITIGVDSDRKVIETHATAQNGDRRQEACTFICGDAIEFLESYEWRGDELVYADPPYLMATRSTQRRYYRNELSSKFNHQLLLTVLQKLPCFVMLSGYASEQYAEQLAGWRLVTIPTITRGGPATECLWCNFAEPLSLHDYRFLGSDYRQRERIKKKKRRWVTKLRTMPALERHAILAAIGELASTGAAVVPGTPRPSTFAAVPPASSSFSAVRDPLDVSGGGGRHASPLLARTAPPALAVPEAK